MNCTARFQRCRDDGGHRPRAEDFRASEARDPVGKAVGRIEGSDDKPGAHDQGAPTERRAHLVLAAGLERAVMRGDVFGERIVEGRDGRRFIEPGRLASA